MQEVKNIEIAQKVNDIDVIVTGVHIIYTEMMNYVV